MTAPSNAWAQQPGFDYHGPHMLWEGGWMLLGPLMMITFIALIVAVVVLMLRWFSNRGAGAPTPPQGKALEILKERFARGEIDKEEYEERRRILRD
jgi:putative membrane protein